MLEFDIERDDENIKTLFDILEIARRLRDDKEFSDNASIFSKLSFIILDTVLLILKARNTDKPADETEDKILDVDEYDAKLNCLYEILELARNLHEDRKFCQSVKCSDICLLEIIHSAHALIDYATDKTN